MPTTPAHDNRSQAAPGAPLPLAGTVALLLVPVLFTVALRVHLLGVPLERDEGGYAYTAWQLMKGVPPFAEAFDVKMPFLYVVYAGLMKLFGPSVVGIHVGLTACSAVTAILVFLLTRELMDERAGLAAATLYTALAASQYVLGFTANAEALLLPFALAGLLAYRIALRRGAAWLFLVAGLLAGLSFIVKHQAAVFVAMMGLDYLSRARAKPRPAPRAFLVRGAAMALGALAPFLLQTSVYAALGLLDRYWYWLFRYPAAYAQRSGFGDGLGALSAHWQVMTRSYLGIELLAAGGLVSVFAAKHAGDRRWFVLLFLAFSFLGVCPGLLFLEHYWVLLLPALAMCGGLGVAAAADLEWPGAADSRAAGSRTQTLRRWGVTVALVAGACGYFVVREREYLFAMSPDEISRACYDGNPFPEAPPIGRYIREHSAASDRVVILGSEPEILFHAQRKSASPHLFMYPLMKESPDALRMQEEIIRSVEEQKPRYLVQVDVAMSWLGGARSPARLADWYERYAREHYDIAGFVDLISPQRTEYRWGADLSGYRRQGRFGVTILERKRGE